MKTTVLNLSAAIIALMICWSPAEAGTLTNGPEGQNRNTLRAINKSIKKDVRKLKKKRYDTEIGAPGMEWQLRNSYDKEFSLDEEGRNNYIIGVGSAFSGIQNVSRRHAASDAQIDACTQLESRILGMIESDYNNKLYSRKEYESLSRMKGVFANMLAQTLPIGTPACTFLKDNGKVYTYQIRIAYSTGMMEKKAMEVIGEILGKENDELRQKMERITGLDHLGIDFPENR